MERSGAGSSLDERGPGAGRAGETVAVVLAAGEGPRVGAEINRVFLPLHGKPILVHALERFEHSPRIDRIIAVISEADGPRYQREVRGRYWLPKLRGVVLGGATRAESAYNAVQYLRPSILDGRIGTLLIHDATRPLFEPHLLEWLLEGVRETGACVPALRAPELIARVASEGHIAEVYRPEPVWAIQTPQAFAARLLLDSYEPARRAGCADMEPAWAVERAGHAVRVVPGDQRNLKVTSPDDLMYAEMTIEQGGFAAQGRQNGVARAYHL